MSRQRGLQLEAFGSILIVTVMVTDRFLFSVQDGFILACAIVSAISLIIGIRAVKRADDRAAAQAMEQARARATVGQRGSGHTDT